MEDIYTMTRGLGLSQTYYHQHFFYLFAFQIDFDRWRCDPEDDVEEEETRNVMNDYPGLYERLQKDEIGYRKGKNVHQINQYRSTGLSN